MEFRITVATTARKDLVLKRLDQMKKEIKYFKQLSWIFSQRYLIVVDVSDLSEAAAICDRIGADFERVGLTFSEC